MISNLLPKRDIKWLKTNAIKTNDKGWYFLRDHRIVIFVDGKIKIIGRWDDVIIAKEQK